MAVQVESPVVAQASAMESVLQTFDLNVLDFYMILVCAAAFYCYWRVSEKMLFGPLLNLYVDRERLTSGAPAEASEQRAEAKRLTDLYESESTEARIQVMQMKLESLREANLKAQAIIRDAEDRARETLAEERLKLKSSQMRVVQDLSAEIDSLSNAIVARVMENPGSVTSSIERTGSASSEGSRSNTIKNSFLVVIASVLSLSPLELHAAPSSGHAPSVWDTLPFWPNFIVFIGLLFFLLRKPFWNFWNERRASLSNALSGGKVELAEAAKSLTLAKSLYSTIDTEIRRIRDETTRNTQGEVAHILEKAQERVRAVKTGLQESIDTERKLIEIEVRNEVTRRAVEKAENVLREKISAEGDSKLRKSAFSNLSRLVQQ